MKTRKILLVALLVLISLVSVVVATQLGIFFSGDVVTTTVEGSVKLSQTNSPTATWVDTLTGVATGDEWYAQFEVIGDGYAGTVTITLVLQEKIAEVWTDTAFTTISTCVLSSSSEIIYASTDGLIGGNYNWGQHTTTASTWRIANTVEN